MEAGTARGTLMVENVPMESFSVNVLLMLKKFILPWDAAISSLGKLCLFNNCITIIPLSPITLYQNRL